MVKEQIFLETNKGNVDDKTDGMRKKYNIIYADPPWKYDRQKGGRCCRSQISDNVYC